MRFLGLVNFLRCDIADVWVGMLLDVVLVHRFEPLDFFGERIKVRISLFRSPEVLLRFVGFCIPP